MPPSHILFKKKSKKKNRKPKEEEEEEEEEICWGWPRGGSATPRVAVWGPNHPLGPWWWFGHPQTAGLGVAKSPSGQTRWLATPYGVVRTPQHISSSSSSSSSFLLVLCFVFLNKIYGGVILGKKMSEWSNCNNLKVWGG